MQLKSIHIGVGGRGQWPVKLMSRDPRWHPVALVDLNESALKEAGNITGLSDDVHYKELQAALAAHPEAEVVVVVTPSALHARFIDEALDAGRHVLVEKPFTNSMDDAERLVEKAQGLGLKIVVSQNYRFSPTERAVQRLVHEQAFGAPSYAEIIHHRYRPEVRAFTMDQPMLYEMSVHHFDSLLAFFAPRRPVAMTARSFNPPWSKYPGPAAVSAIIELEGPIVVTYLGTFTSQSTRWTNRIECEHGAICWGAGEPLRAIRPGGRDSEAETLPVEDGKLSQEMQILDAFYRYIEEGVEPEISGRNNLETMRLVCGCITSSEEGQTVRFTKNR